MLTPKSKIFLSFFAVWLAAGSLSVYLRLYPLRVFTTPDSTEKATMLVLNNVRTKIIEGVNKNHPDATTEEKNRLIKENIDRVLHEDGQQMRATVERVSREIEQDKPAGIRKSPYLLASDSFYYYSLTENIVNTGKIAEKTKGSKYFNELMLNPLGHWEPVNLHPYVGFFVYKAVKFFQPDADLMFGVSFTPLVVTLLALIPFLALCRMLGCGALASFAGAMLFLNSNFVLKRTMFAWYDNDPHSLTFLLTLFVCLFYGLKHRLDLKRSVAGGLLSAAVISLYALFWHGWVFFLGNLAVSGVVCVAYSFFILKDGSAKNVFLFFVSIVLGTLAGITAVFGPGEFFVLFQEGFKALTEFMTPKLAPWPDLYIGVGELNKPSFAYLVELSGGRLVFFGSVIGAALYFQRTWKGQNGNPLWVLAMAVLFASSFVISLGAMRFSFLLAVVLGALFPLMIQYVLDLIQEARFLKNARLQKIFPVTVNVLIVAVMTLISFKYAERSIPSLLNRIFNPVWENALVTIREKTPPESVVNTWWPPGHFIKTVAKRRVTFDGATINNPQGYWLANVFIAQDERTSAGLLRMLNNSANLAAEYLQSQEMKLSEAVKLLYAVTPLSRDKAEEFLQGKLSDGQAAHLLSLTHAEPPPSYLLLTSEEIEKNIQYKFVGGWNFEKVEKINADPVKLRSVPRAGSRDYIDFLWEIAGGSYDASPVMSLLSTEGDLLTFEKNIKVNLAAKDAVIQTSSGIKFPHSLFYLDGGRVVEKKFPGASLPLSVLLFKTDNTYACLLLDPRLGRSTLMQLYFYDARGSKYFEPLTLESDLTGRTRIKVFRVKWGSFLKDIETN